MIQKSNLHCSYQLAEKTQGHVFKGDSEYVNALTVDHIYTFRLSIWLDTLWAFFYFC